MSAPCERHVLTRTSERSPSGPQGRSDTSGFTGSANCSRMMLRCKSANDLTGRGGAWWRRSGDGGVEVAARTASDSLL